MKKFLFILALVLLGAIEARSQTNANLVFAFVAPAGGCANLAPLQVLSPNGTLYSCQNGTWGTVGGGGGAGTVTSVSWTGGIVSIATPTTTPAFTIAGTSGGIPFFSGAATWASSALLAANKAMVGGGAGITPSTTNVTITNPPTTATLTLADNSSLITSGAFATTLTSTATSNATLPAGTTTLLANSRNVNTTAPLGGGGALSADLTLTCTTCATTTNGGALSATAPITISAAGVIACATCTTTSPWSVNTQTFSATPQYDLSLGTVQTITLTGNVTASTFINGTAGKFYTFIICQDGTGGRTYVFGAAWHSPMTIGSTLNLCSAQEFAALNATTLYAVAPGIINQ